MKYKEKIIKLMSELLDDIINIVGIENVFFFHYIDIFSFLF